MKKHRDLDQMKAGETVIISYKGKWSEGSRWAYSWDLANDGMDQMRQQGFEAIGVWGTSDDRTNVLYKKMEDY